MNSDRVLAQSYSHCGRIARRQAKNFYPSFLLLPAVRRRSMCALYAFMRQTDDIADEPGEINHKKKALQIWRDALDEALKGQPGEWLGWPALSDAVARHAIPARYLHAVIDGVAMDLSPRTFATFEDLRVYCYHVASAVGLCCIHIWGFRSDGGKAEAMAESCGLALQLTNIIRDVGEDARDGRVYLPDEDLVRFGVNRDDLTAPQATEPLKRLLAFEARRAYEEYERAGPLTSLVDPVGRPVLLTIAGIYRALLDRIERKNYDVLSERISVPTWRKASIAARSFGARFNQSTVSDSDVEVRPIR